MSVLARAQLLEKFCDQIPHHRRSISRGGSNIVDRLNLRDCRFFRQSQQRRIDRLSCHQSFRFRQPNRNRRNTSQCDADIFDHATGAPAQRRDAHFGNGLRVARSNFTRVSKMSGKSPRQANRPNQFIRRQFRLLVTGMKVPDREPSAPREPTPGSVRPHRPAARAESRLLAMH